MAEETETTVIGKLEPIGQEEEEEPEEVDMKTLELYQQDGRIEVLNDVQVNTTDGNLQINTYQIVEEIEGDENYLEDAPQHVLIRTEDGSFIHEDGELYVEEEQYNEEGEYEEIEQYELQNIDGSEDDDENFMGEGGDSLQDVEDPEAQNSVDATSSTASKEEEEEQIKPHPCPICHRTFKSSSSLKRHITVLHNQQDASHTDPLELELCNCCGEPSETAHTKGTIPCTKSPCKQRFVTQNNLIRHLSIEHPNENGIYKCCDCIRSFDNRDAINKHMASHPLAKPFSCLACNRDFTRKYHLERHVIHTGCDGVKREQYKCEVCNKKFTRKDNLRDHLRAHAGQVKKKQEYPCTYCDKVFQGAGLLAIHTRTHTGEKPYACDLCPKWFPSTGAMKKHRRMHTGERPYQCMQCKKRFAAKETLNRHTRTHTGYKPHVCSYCGKGFIQAVQLRAHIFHHTGEHAFTCPHCNKAFNRRVRLTTHIKFVHEGAEPMQCKLCSKKFYRKEDQARHELLHSGEKPYECEVCHKRFAVKVSLKIHSNTHRKEQPCSCYECGRAYIRQDCLLRHMRAKHRDVLEDIMVCAEKKRLQEQLLSAASETADSEDSKPEIKESSIWNELTLTDSIKELLGLLIDEVTLVSFGWPDTPVDKILDCVIKRCGHEPASPEHFDYISRIRENAKLLFTVVIDDEAVKSLLNNQTVDEVIQHVLKLARSD